MPRTTTRQSDTRRTRILRRVLRGRKRVEVGRWKWDFPQSLTTLQRVPLPPQRVPLPRQRVEQSLLTFAEFLVAYPLDHDTITRG